MPQYARLILKSVSNTCHSEPKAKNLIKSRPLNKQNPAVFTAG